MQFTTVFFAALAATLAQACDHCPHPGNFPGNVYGYLTTTPNSCDVTVGPDDIVASLPASFWVPRDESPCDEPISVTLTSSGKTVTAIVINSDPNLSNDDIGLNTAGLAALAADSDPNHGSGPAIWTFL
ncbi:hypothetical protein SISNIDRAFT_546178 [Sistotremastrum niveocremeum HHB9708]|uniref:Uncharacterized protein n=1 Tax=Sistotremastrum niveocremeum HHB9708 TaxID=1314777 RepID=A0A164ZWT4_9AGAM|nr:hypothetical protein SISNIDRAFT_546178 [Sistotremastrum niveocremeum HHB9708]